MKYNKKQNCVNWTERLKHGVVYRSKHKITDLTNKIQTGTIYSFW